VQEQLGSVRTSNRDPIKHNNTIMNVSFGNDCSIVGRYACQEELSSTVSMSAQYHCYSVGISLIVSLHNVAAHRCRFHGIRVMANFLAHLCLRYHPSSIIYSLFLCLMHLWGRCIPLMPTGRALPFTIRAFSYSDIMSATSPVTS